MEITVITKTVVIEQQTKSGMTPHQKLTEIFRPYLGDAVDIIMADAWRIGALSGTGAYDEVIAIICEECELNIDDVIEQLEIVEQPKICES